MIAAHDSSPPLRIYSQFLIVGGKKEAGTNSFVPASSKKHSNTFTPKLF